MKQLLESWRLFQAETENTEKHQKYFDIAIAEADSYDDHEWSMDDFNVERLGLLTINELEKIVHFGEWAANEPTDLEGIEPLQRVDSIIEFDSTEKKEAARTYIKHPEIRPPVVLVTAPDSDNDSMFLRFGYGTGLVNLHMVLGLPKIEVYHLKYKHKVNTRKRGLAGPPGRLKDY